MNSATPMKRLSATFNRIHTTLGKFGYKMTSLQFRKEKVEHYGSNVFTKKAINHDYLFLFTPHNHLLKQYISSGIPHINIGISFDYFKKDFNGAPLDNSCVVGGGGSHNGYQHKDIAEWKGKIILSENTSNECFHFYEVSIDFNEMKAFYRDFANFLEDFNEKEQSPRDVFCMNELNNAVYNFIYNRYKNSDFEVIDKKSPTIFSKSKSPESIQRRRDELEKSLASIDSQAQKKIVDREKRLSQFMEALDIDQLRKEEAEARQKLSKIRRKLTQSVHQCYNDFMDDIGKEKVDLKHYDLSPESTIKMMEGHAMREPDEHADKKRMIRREMDFLRNF